MTAEEKAIWLLRKLRETLQSYADSHLAKAPPQPAKAKVNLELVHEINDLLLSLATDMPLLLTPAEVVRDPDTIVVTLPMLVDAVHGRVADPQQFAERLWGRLVLTHKQLDTGR